MLLEAHARSIVDVIPEDQKRGMDPVMIYDIIVLACKGIVACSNMPLMQTYCQQNYSNGQFSASSTTATAFQIRRAARKLNYDLPIGTARQWSHAMLLQTMNTPEETLATCVLECSEPTP